MKAVILAGGRGERLRPITDTRPKPLVPVLARPVMDYCLSLLAHHGVKEAYVTTHYLADQIRHRYGKEAFGMSLFYSCEETPLGTAGGVKCLEEHFLDEEMFLIMSGDALCDFNLSRAMAFHREKNADVTIVLSSVKTPLEYGVVLADTFEKIFAFSEKPDWSETFSDQVNTGVYILSPRVLSRIPKEKKFDFSQDLFPLLLREGYRLFGFKEEGYWCDIGKIPTLYRCNLDLMAGKAKTYLPPCGRTLPSADGKGKYFVSDTARVDQSAVIRDGVVISEGATVAAGTKISSALIMEKAKMGKDAVVSGGILCENVTLREGAQVLAGSVLGAGSVAMPDAVTKAGRKYPPFSVITRRPAFQEEGLIFTEKGVSGEREVGLSAEDAEYLGRAFALALNKDVLILWDEKSGSSYFASLFAGGVVCKGKNALLLGEGRESIASFAARFYHLPTVFVSTEEKRGVFFAFGEDGLPLPRKEVLRVLRFPREDEDWEKTGEVVSVKGITGHYVEALAREMGSLTGFQMGFYKEGSRLLKEAAIKSGVRAYTDKENDFSLEMFEGGMKFFIHGVKVADTEKIRLYLIEREMERGIHTFYLPDVLPAFFKEHVESRGGKVNFFSFSEDLLSEGRRKGAAPWYYDNAFLGARLISEIAGKTPESVRRRFDATPDLYISCLQYRPKEELKAKILGSVQKEVTEKGAKVRLRPGFYGIRIVSEAQSAEAALESAFEYRGKLYEIEKSFGGK